MSRASLFAALLLLSPLLACETSTAASTEAPSEDSVDALTRDLLAALTAGDREATQALSNAALATALDERALATLATTLTWLGELGSLARVEDRPVSGGVERRYRAGFERDELTLTVTVVNQKLEGFEFDPGQWEVVSERAAEAAAGSLRVAAFEFVGPDGQPISGPIDPTDVRYSLALEGLDVQLREHHVVIAKQVLDGEGRQVYRQDRDDDIRFPQAEAGAIGGRITGSVMVPGPGRYEVELKITDLVAGQTIVHRVPLTIE